MFRRSMVQLKLALRLNEEVRVDGLVTIAEDGRIKRLNFTKQASVQTEPVSEDLCVAHLVVKTVDDAMAQIVGDLAALGYAQGDYIKGLFDSDVRSLEDEEQKLFATIEWIDEIRNHTFSDGPK